MTHGSLFSGIGGFDLAAEWMGWENIFHSEINEFGQKILKHYWPDAISYTDIKKTDFSVHRAEIDIVTGGFPCQPFSAAGNRKGTEDDRYLWPEMLRAIREISPDWVVGENVLGLLNWSNGLVFHQVQTDMEAAGYICFPYVLPACSQNAPHVRYRTWVVAYSKTKNAGLPIRKKEKYPRLSSNDGNGCVANAEIKRFQKRYEEQIQNRTYPTIERYGSISRWENFPTQSPVCSRNDGLPGGLAGITISKHRTESIKAFGNAIVPQVAYEIFKAIEQYDTNAKG